MNKITINDVAKRAGVSKVTVSAVINDKNCVRPVTRDLVLNVMKELNFRPKGMARILKAMNWSMPLRLPIFFQQGTYRSILIERLSKLPCRK